MENRQKLLVKKVVVIWQKHQIVYFINFEVNVT